MTKTFLASVAIAAIALAGCAKEEKMMKDPAPAAAESVTTEPVTYSAPPKKEVMVDESAGQDPMMDLCFEKGGQIGEWPGENASTKTCRAADGNEYPLASLSSYEAFQ